MKLSTNIYQRLLWITASASLLGIVGCSNLPRTASSNDTAKYGTNGRRLASIMGVSPTAYNPYSDPPPAQFGSPPAVPPGGGFGADNAHSAPAASSISTSPSSTASSGTSSGGHSGGTTSAGSTASSGAASGGHSGGK